MTIAQPTWSDDVAEIFYNNCTSCHHSEGIAPFSLLDYSTASTWASAIYANVNAGTMPPWTADSSFQHYYGERILTAYERTTILDWVTGGALAGDLGTAPPPPVYSGAKILPGEPDMTVQIPNYMSKATGFYDDYVCFSIPSGLTSNKKVKAIEVVPGNQAIVHHVVVYHDADASYVTDTVGSDCTGPVDDEVIAGFAPGSNPTIYPSTADWQAGVELDAGSNIVLAMHYPEGSYGQWDSTKVNFYFYEEPVASFRNVYNYPLIIDFDFLIDAETIEEVKDTFDILADWTFISAMPHMHLLGKSIETYALTPAGDTIPLVRIPQWDFEWQDIYFFDHLIPIMGEDTLYGNGVFDNTSSNPHNPNDPPVDVGFGLNTTDEMFLVSFSFMLYQAGDEDISQDSLNTVFLSNEYADLALSEGDEVKVFPNPFEDNTTIEYTLPQSTFVSLYIYDAQGRVIRRVLRKNQAAGNHLVGWDGKNNEGAVVQSGMYYYSMMIDGVNFSGRILKK